MGSLCSDSSDSSDSSSSSSSNSKEKKNNDPQPYRLSDIKRAIHNYNGKIQGHIIPSFVNYQIECLPTQMGIRRRVCTIVPNIDRAVSETSIQNHCRIENIDDRMLVWLTDDEKNQIFQ